MKTIAQRIAEGLQLRGMKQAELVEKTGIGKSSISTYITGAYEPKQRNIYNIAKALDVSVAWLMGEDVPMERNKNISSFPLDNVSSILPEELNFLKKYRLLDNFGRELVTLVLEKEGERLNKYGPLKSDNITAKEINTPLHDFSKAIYLMPDAAHSRTDLELTDLNKDLSDNDIMDDPDF